jgi:hypothetical protein
MERQKGPRGRNMKGKDGEEEDERQKIVNRNLKEEDGEKEF